MYTPTGPEKGTNLFEIALRDYIAADAEISAQVPLSRIVPEGYYTDTYGPNSEGLSIVISSLGDGNQDYYQLYRYIIYVLSPRRGYFVINSVIERLRNMINDSAAVNQYFTFPPDRDLQVLHLEARGTTASTSFPIWNSEGKGIYLFAKIAGHNVSY